MSDEIDKSKWTCDYVAVPVNALRVKSVDHEVVEWEASFCSEDAIPLRLVYDKYLPGLRAFEVINDRVDAAPERSSESSE